MPTDLTEHRARWMELDGVVKRGLATFIEVGQALGEIASSQLYLERYETFDAYLEDRGLSRSRAYQLLQSAKIAENVSTIVDTAPANEAQARPLAKVPAEHQAEVWQAAVERAKAEGRDAPTGQMVADAVCDWEPEEEDDEDSPPEPAGVARMAEDNAEIRAWQSTARRVRELLLTLTDLPAAPHLSDVGRRTVDGQVEACLQAAADMEAATRNLGTATGAGLCPACGGSGCRRCLKTGYLPAAGLAALKRELE